MPASFASASDVEAGWRLLTDDERSRAEVLIGRASRMIRRRWTTVDARIEDGSDPLTLDDVTDVVSEMVQTAMTGPLGVTEEDKTLGPFAHGVKYANPQGSLYLTKAMVAVFEPAGPTAVTRWLV